MGYKWRPTKGRVDCRPFPFRSDKYPPNSSICSPSCIYWQICQIRTKRIIKPLSQEDKKLLKKLIRKLKKKLSTEKGVDKSF